MAYTPTVWKNDEAPALNADNLNKLEQGVVAASAPKWADISGKPTLLAIGTTATTAKAGNYTPAWGDVTGRPTTFAPAIGTTATTAMAGNTALLQIGTTATTAKAGNWKPAIADLPTGTTATTVALGNHTHTATQITATAVGGGTATNVQEILAELAARIAALETP